MSITVAETEADLFYSESTGVQENLCGYIEGQLDASAYIRCNSAIAGRFVQVQNTILSSQDWCSQHMEQYFESSD